MEDKIFEEKKEARNFLDGLSNKSIIILNLFLLDLPQLIVHLL